MGVAVSLALSSAFHVCTFPQILAVLKMSFVVDGTVTSPKRNFVLIFHQLRFATARCSRKG